MDKRPRNPRVKKRLLKDFGEEHIGADRADETDDESVSNTKFYYLRDLPEKIYHKDDGDNENESYEDFSPVVSEYFPSPEHRNHITSTPSSSLGGDSEYIEALHSKLSRTPSTISNISLTLNQIDFVASPSEVFIPDNNNYNCKSIVDITLKPAPVLHQNQICSTAYYGIQLTDTNSLVERGEVTCTTEANTHDQGSSKSNQMAMSLSPPCIIKNHTKAMQITELDSTLKPEETLSAMDLTLRSSLSDSGSFSILDPVVNNNMPLMVSHSCVPENDLPCSVNDVTASTIVLPSNVDPRNKETALLNVFSSEFDLKKELLAAETIMPSTDAEPIKNIPVSESVTPSITDPVTSDAETQIVVPYNAESRREVPASEIMVSSNSNFPVHEIFVSSNANPTKNNISVPEIVVSSNAEHVRKVLASEIMVPSNADISVHETVVPSGKDILALVTVVPSTAELGNILPSTDAKPLKNIPASVFVLPSNTDPARNDVSVSEIVVLSNTEPRNEVPAPEIVVLSNAEPRRKVPAPEIMVPSNTEIKRKVTTPEIMAPSNTTPRREVAAPEIVVPSNTKLRREVVSSNAEPRREVSGPEIMVPSNAQPRREVLVPEIIVPSNADVPVHEIFVTSKTDLPRNDVPIPVVVVPSNGDYGNDVPALDIVVPSTAESENNGPVPVTVESNISVSENHASPSECENDESLSEPTKKRTRKRKLDIDEWQSTKNKKLKDSGQAYKGCHSKKEYPAKTMGPACSCKKACSERISPHKRKEIFDKYYKIGSHEHQWQFIVRNVEVQDIKRITLNRKCNRTQTLKYNFHIDGVKHPVCKNFFINTLNISDTVIFTALEKVKRDESLIDLRGCHKNRPHKTNSSTEESVVQHIKLFPTVEAHYVRKDSEKLYLYDDLNISKMYRLYKKWFAEQNQYLDVKMATAKQYRKIFNTQFNYSFFKPKKDQCAICTRYDQADEETKNSMQINYDKHLKNKETVRDIKDDEKEKTKTNNLETVAIFDLEKVLYIPKSEVGVFYYKRKYPVYNFTIYDAGRKLGYCYMWHFKIAKRGAIEIGSCILMFLENEHNKSVTKISFYSDGCRGQNKNRFIFALYLYAAAKFEMNITHRFFETGHSQNEGDSMHACIEREIKKNKYIYTPEQMYAIAMNAKVTDEKYSVVEMDQSDFVNIKMLIEGQNWVHDSNGNKIMWSNIMEVNASHTHPGKLKFKYSFEDEYLELNTCEIPNRVTRRTQSTRAGRARAGTSRGGHVGATSSTVESSTVEELQRAYNQPLPVSKALHCDLLSLCKSHDIPRHYHEFYESLTYETNENVEAQEPLHEDDS